MYARPGCRILHVSTSLNIIALISRVNIVTVSPTFWCTAILHLTGQTCLTIPVHYLPIRPCQDIRAFFALPCPCKILIPSTSLFISITNITRTEVHAKFLPLPSMFGSRVKRTRIFIIHTLGLFRMTTVDLKTGLIETITSSIIEVSGGVFLTMVLSCLLHGLAHQESIPASLVRLWNTIRLRQICPFEAVCRQSCLA